MIYQPGLHRGNLKQNMRLKSWALLLKSSLQNNRTPQGISACIFSTSILPHLILLAASWYILCTVRNICTVYCVPTCYCNWHFFCTWENADATEICHKFLKLWNQSFQRLSRSEHIRILIFKRICWGERQYSGGSDTMLTQDIGITLQENLVASGALIPMQFHLMWIIILSCLLLLTFPSIWTANSKGHALNTAIQQDESLELKCSYHGHHPSLS